MRWAAQCTEGVGGCQLRRRGTGGAERRSGAHRQRRAGSPPRGSAAGAPMHAPQLGRKSRPGSTDVLMRTEGTVSANRAGYGFVRSEDLAESVFLPPAQMRGLMHGDRVRIAVRGDGQGRYLGEVLEVLERGVQAFL